MVQRRQAARRLGVERDRAPALARLIAELHHRGAGWQLLAQTLSSAMPQLPPVQVVTSRMSGPHVGERQRRQRSQACGSIGIRLEPARDDSREAEASSASRASNRPVSSESTGARRACSFRTSSSRRNVLGLGEPRYVISRLGQREAQDDEVLQIVVGDLRARRAGRRTATGRSAGSD